MNKPVQWIGVHKWILKDPVTGARQVDYVFMQLWFKFILSGMYSTGQILNFDDRRECVLLPVM